MKVNICGWTMYVSAVEEGRSSPLDIKNRDTVMVEGNSFLQARNSELRIPYVEGTLYTQILQLKF